ncbi:cortistatin-like [Discoglossus pictus]
MSIFSMQLLLLLILVFCRVGTAAPARGEKVMAQDGKILQELSEGKKNSLLTALSTMFDWASQEEGMPSVTNEEPEIPYRQQRSMFHQAPARDRASCKNFFWKTFSTC